MEALRNTAGFLGSGGNLLVDFTLVIQILFFIVLCAGVAVQLAANRGKPDLYKWHDRLQAPVVVLNLLFIIFVMLPAFGAVAGNLSNFGSTSTWVPFIHGLLGLAAQGVAIYCLLAGFKILPRKIGVLRYWMWTAFTLWAITLLFGIAVYLTYYGGSAAGSPAIPEHEADLITEHEEAVVDLPTEAAELVEEHAEEPVLVEEATEAPVEEHAEEPVVVEPTEPPPTEEAAPAVEPDPAGLARTSDGNIHHDRVVLQLSGVAPPDEGFVYEGWLQGEGTPPLSVGILPVENGSISYEFVDPAGRNLIEPYNGAFITLEPANDSDPNPSGAVVYSGQLPPAVMAHVRHVVSAIPVTPDGDGFALNGLAEAGLILQQIEVQQESVAGNDLANLHIHAETTLNIIEGENSPDYGDRDGDGETFNPGDGFGLLSFGEGPGYLAGAAQHAVLARDAEGASANVALHAEHVEIAAANASDWAEQLRDLQLQILAVEEPAAAGELVAQAAALATTLLEGVDANGDGQIAPVPGEGGIRTMYQHGQLMGGIELFAAEGEPVAPAVEPTPELVEEHAEELPQEVEPEPTDTPAPTATPQPQPTATPQPTPTPTVELVSEHDG